MSQESPFDPYQPPSLDEPPLNTKVPINYRAILKRWRPLRFQYNLILLAVGLLVSLPLWLAIGPFLILGILFYAAFANFFFSFGVLPEIFIAFAYQEEDLPTLRKFIYLLGLLFSMIVTLGIGIDIWLSGI